MIPTATTWMTGSQPVQLIRATSAINIGHSPRANIAQSPRTKIESNICFLHTFKRNQNTFCSKIEFINNKQILHLLLFLDNIVTQSGTGANTMQNVSQQQTGQNVSSSNATGE